MPSMPGVTIDYDGKRFHFQMLSSKLLTELGNWMLLKDAESLAACDMAMVNVGAMEKSEMRERNAAFRESAREQGTYAIGSKRMMEVLGVLQAANELASLAEANAQPFTPPPNVIEPFYKIVSLIIGCDVDTVINLLHERPDETISKLTMVLGASLPPKADAAVTAGTPPQTTAPQTSLSK